MGFIQSFSKCSAPTMCLAKEDLLWSYSSVTFRASHLHSTNMNLWHYQ
jgi:hypothetical protein